MFRPAVVVGDDHDAMAAVVLALDHGVKNTDRWSLTADRPAEALRHLEEVRASLVFVVGHDVPGLVVELIREAPELAMVAVVDDLTEVGAALEAGATSYLRRDDIDPERIQSVAEETLATAGIEHLGSAHEVVEDLVPLLAHHLREPIRSARLFNDRGRASTDRRWHDLVEHSLERADLLARSLLEYLRLDPAAVGPTRIVDLATIGSELRDEYRERVRATGATLDIDLHGTVRCQPSSIRRILRILVDNGFEHVGSAAPRITVTCSAIDDDLVDIRVADRGPGLRRAQERAAFRPLERLTEQGDGVGMGLPLARRLAQLGDGTLVLEPSSGPGTTMRLRLHAG